jgi:hypothetical protein
MKKKKIMIQLEEEALKRLKKVARADNRSHNKYIERLVYVHLEENGEKE